MKNKTLCFMEIAERTQAACKENNLQKIKKILFSEDYPNLTLEEKENYMLMNALIVNASSNYGIDVIRYLIVECNVPENPGLKLYVTEEVQELYNKRKLNKELSSNLTSSEAIPIKFIKI